MLDLSSRPLALCRLAVVVVVAVVAVVAAVVTGTAIVVGPEHAAAHAASSAAPAASAAPALSFPLYSGTPPAQPLHCVTGSGSRPLSCLTASLALALQPRSAVPEATSYKDRFQCVFGSTTIYAI